VNRPELGKIFTEGVLREKGRKNEKVEEAVDRFGYTQREVADFRGLHFTSVSRIMNQRSKNAKKIDPKTWIPFCALNTYF